MEGCKDTLSNLNVIFEELLIYSQINLIIANDKKNDNYKISYRCSDRLDWTK